MRRTRRRRASRRSCAVSPCAVARGLVAISLCQACTNLASRKAAAFWQAVLAEQVGLGGATAKAAVVGERAGAVVVEAGAVVEAARAGVEAAVAAAGAGLLKGWEALVEVGRVVLAGGKASRNLRCT